MPPPDHPEAESRPSPSRARDLATAGACILAGLAFGVAIWQRRGPEPAQQYLAGYLIELSLSVDNVFVFALVFEQFNVEPARRRRLLLWGVAGAIVMRSAFLVAGIGAIHRFSWIIPVFGALILITGIRIASRRGERALAAPGNPAVGFLVRHVPAAMAALIAVEAADLVFALDSLPAVLAVTHDVLIAIASNLFAILGLRSLYFVVSGAVQELRFLTAGLAGILILVGAKMLAEPWYHVSTTASLGAISAVLGLSIGASLLLRKDSRR
jgi:tellurite resistance protein TerC